MRRPQEQINNIFLSCYASNLMLSAWLLGMISVVNKQLKKSFDKNISRTMLRKNAYKRFMRPGYACILNVKLTLLVTS